MWWIFGYIYKVVIYWEICVGDMLMILFVDLLNDFGISYWIVVKV